MKIINEFAVARRNTDYRATMRLVEDNGTYRAYLDCNGAREPVVAVSAGGEELFRRNVSSYLRNEGLKRVAKS